MKYKKYENLRKQVTQEAARILYEEGISEYWTAKRMAIRRVTGSSKGRRVVHFSHILPSNQEIREALLHRASLLEGTEHTHRLFAIRVIALQTMYALQAFEPRLIGSVHTRHIWRGSDIDIHVFTDDICTLECELQQQGWSYEIKEVTVRKGSTYAEYQHIYMHCIFPIELSIYSLDERHRTQRSSIDGKPIQRISAKTLHQKLTLEHTQAWDTYISTGILPSRDKFAEELEYTTLADE